MTSIGSASAPVIPAVAVAFEERAERRGATVGVAGSNCRNPPEPSPDFFIRPVRSCRGNYRLGTRMTRPGGIFGPIIGTIVALAH